MISNSCWPKPLIFNKRSFYFQKDGMCKIGQFVCNNRNCVKHNVTCDAHNDCGDWSDETHCRGWCHMRITKIHF